MPRTNSIVTDANNKKKYILKKVLFIAILAVLPFAMSVFKRLKNFGTTLINPNNE